jgi:DNA-binding response OmpR family regulator
MLTAKDTLDDKITGFDAGADDYLIKPFALRELEARLFALVRRANRDYGKVLILDGLQVDMKRRLVTRAGKIIQVNRSGFRILVELMSRAPDVVTREDLEHLLWGDWRPDSDALRSHIYALRKAIDNDNEKSLIETIHGVGFRMGNPT